MDGEEIKSVEDVLRMMRSRRSIERVDLEADLCGSVSEVCGIKRFRHPCHCDDDEYRPTDNAFLNSRYAEWKQKCVEHIEAQDWEALLFNYSKPFYLDALKIIKEKVPNQYPIIARRAWTESDELTVNIAGWREVFADRALGVSGFMDASEQSYLERKLPVTFIVYRGCGAVNIDGLSWTISLDSAENFERDVKPRRDARIVEGTIKKSDVIAYVQPNKEEFEIIVAPEHVVSRRTIKLGGQWL